MELNPQKSLRDLEATYLTYLSSAPEQRRELAVTLQRSINHSEIEIGNLARDAAANVEKRVLYKRLMCTVEMAKVSIEEGGARR